MLQNFKNREFSDELSNISTPSISYLARTNAQVHFYILSLSLPRCTRIYNNIRPLECPIGHLQYLDLSPVVWEPFPERGIRRFDDRRIEPPNVAKCGRRPRLSPFMLISLIRYFHDFRTSADMPFHITVLYRIPSTAGQADEPKTKYSRRKEIIEKQFIARTAYYVKTYRSISESLMNLIMITRMLAYVSSHIFIIHRLRKNSSFGSNGGIIYTDILYDKYIYNSIEQSL